MLICRHETTSAAVAWALYELSEHPEIQSRLRQEIHSVLGKSFHPHNPITQDQLDQMSYLNNVCREVLRIDPPGVPSPFQLTHSPNYRSPSSRRRRL